MKTVESLRLFFESKKAYWDRMLDDEAAREDIGRTHTECLLLSYYYDGVIDGLDECSLVKGKN